MNKTLFVLVTAFLIVIAPGAQASSRSATYTGSSPGLAAVQCNDGCGAAPGVNFGGYHFVANGKTPVSVSAVDASGAAVYVQACQDSNANSICGEAGEPNAAGCGAATLVGFSANRDTVVFIYWSNLALSGAVPTCVGATTTGTITLTESP